MTLGEQSERIRMIDILTGGVERTRTLVNMSKSEFDVSSVGLARSRTRVCQASETSPDLVGWQVS